jgi:hypothetical protein
MKMKTCIQLLGILALATSLSYGQDTPKKGDKKAPAPAKVFKKLDANTDGAVSLEEFKASPRAQKNPAKAEEIFKKIDTDSSGAINLEEFKAHKPDKAPGKRPKKGDNKVE